MGGAMHAVDPAAESNGLYLVRGPPSRLVGGAPGGENGSSSSWVPGLAGTYRPLEEGSEDDVIVVADAHGFPIGSRNASMENSQRITINSFSEGQAHSAEDWQNVEWSEGLIRPSRQLSKAGSGEYMRVPAREPPRQVQSQPEGCQGSVQMQSLPRSRTLQSITSNNRGGDPAAWELESVADSCISRPQERSLMPDEDTGVVLDHEEGSTAKPVDVEGDWIAVAGESTAGSDARANQKGMDGVVQGSQPGNQDLFSGSFQELKRQMQPWAPLLTLAGLAVVVLVGRRRAARRRLNKLKAEIRKEELQSSGWLVFPWARRGKPVEDIPGAKPQHCGWDANLGLIKVHIDLAAPLSQYMCDRSAVKQ